MTTAKELSAYIVTKCITEGKPITNIRLQELLYLIFEAYLEQKNEEIFKDVFEAWHFGPAIPSIYYKYGRFGSHRIDKKHKNINLSKKIQKFVDPIIEENRDKKIWEIVPHIHAQGKPWNYTWQNGKGFKNPITFTLF